MMKAHPYLSPRFLDSFRQPGNRHLVTFFHRICPIRVRKVDMTLSIGRDFFHTSSAFADRMAVVGVRDIDFQSHPIRLQSAKQIQASKMLFIHDTHTSWRVILRIKSRDQTGICPNSYKMFKCSSAYYQLGSL